MNPAAIKAVCGTVGLFLFAAFAYLYMYAGVYVAVLSCMGTSAFVTSLRAEYRQDMALRALLCAGLSPIVAWGLTDLWMLYIVMILWVPLFAGRFDRIVPLYLFNLLLLPGLDYPIEIDELKLFDFGVQDALAVGAAVAVLCGPAKRRVNPGSDGWVLALLLLLAAALARDTSFTNFLRSTCNLLLDLFLPYYILSRGLQRIEATRAAMRWFACSGVTMAMLLLFEAARSWPIFNELYPHYGVPTILLVKLRGGILRPGGTFGESTGMALIVTLCLAAIWLLRDDFRSRVLHRGLCGLVFLGLSAAQSRGAWLGVLFGIVVIDLYNRSLAGLARKLALLGVLFAVIYVAAQFSHALADLTGLSNGGASDTVDYRKMLLQRGMEEFWRSPIIGLSLPQITFLLWDLRQGEGIIDFVNSYLFFALIGGVIGLGIFVGNFLSPAVRLWRVRRSLAHGELEIPALFAFTCVGMVAVMLVFTGFSARAGGLTCGIFGFAAAVSALAYPASGSRTAASRPIHGRGQRMDGRRTLEAVDSPISPSDLMGA